MSVQSISNSTNGHADIEDQSQSSTRRWTTQLSSSANGDNTFHIWVITGPSGCGKSSVAEYLHGQTGIPFIEGDDLHTEENRLKMAHNIPLDDTARIPWLKRVRDQAVKQALEPVSSSSQHPSSVIVTCSALKKQYRDIIRDLRPDPSAAPISSSYPSTNGTTASEPSRLYSPSSSWSDLRLHFLYLKAPPDVLRLRLSRRKHHYMKPAMVQSQFEDLEEPDESELSRDCVAIDCTPPADAVQREALRILRRQSGLRVSESDGGKSGGGNEEREQTHSAHGPRP